MSSGKPNYEFGEFLLDTSEKQLRRLSGEVLQIPPKAFELLTFLVENKGRLLEKDELMDKVWADSFVEEGNLKINIHTLRKALHESGEEYIETVPKRGYRFNADVKTLENDKLIVEKITRSKIVFEQTESGEIENQLRLSTRVKSKMQWRYVFVLGGILLIGSLIYLTFLRPTNNSSNALAGNKAATIAVLPLRNLSKLEADEFLGIGLTDALITKLANIRGLAVRPTSAVLTLTNEDQTTRFVGEKLNVESVLEGSIQREGENLRVRMKLVKTTDGTVLWAEEFNEKDVSLFKIQDSVSARVADALQLKISDQDRLQTAKYQTEDFEAYKHYLRGRYAWNKRTAGSLKDSIKFFREAIDHDPTYALAYAGLADSYALLSEYNVAPPADSFPQAKAAAQKALEIAPNLAEAHSTFGYVLANYDWNFADAEREYRRSIELNPNYATAHQWYAEFLSAMRRFDEAQIEIKKAQELDPLSPIVQTVSGAIQYNARNYDSAIERLNNTLQDNPNFPPAHFYVAMAFERQGNFDEAAREEIEGLRLSGLDQKTVISLQEIYRSKGWESLLQSILVTLNAQAEKSYVPAFHQAYFYARLKNREKTLEWLARSYDERLRYLIFLKSDEVFDFLQDDERFQVLIRRIGL